MILCAFQFGSVEPVASVGLALRQLAVNCESVTRSAELETVLLITEGAQEGNVWQFCGESASICLSNHLSAFAKLPVLWSLEQGPPPSINLHSLTLE